MSILYIKINKKDLLEFGFKETQGGSYILKTNTYNETIKFSRYLKVTQTITDDVYAITSFIENDISEEIWVNYDLKENQIPVGLKNYIYNKWGEE